MFNNQRVCETTFKGADHLYTFSHNTTDKGGVEVEMWVCKCGETTRNARDYGLPIREN